MANCKKTWRETLSDTMYGDNPAFEMWKELTFREKSIKAATFVSRIVPGFNKLPWLVSDALLAIGACGLVWAVWKFSGFLIFLYLVTKLYRFVARNRG